MREILRTHIGDIENMADTTIVDRMAAAVDEVAGLAELSANRVPVLFIFILDSQLFTNRYGILIMIILYNSFYAN